MKESKGNDIPYDLGIDSQDYLDYKEEWILWRTLGHYMDGTWVAPVSFLEAEKMPKRKIDFFFSMDNILELMKNQKKSRTKNG